MGQAEELQGRLDEAARKIAGLQMSAVPDWIWDYWVSYLESLVRELEDYAPSE